MSEMEYCRGCGKQIHREAAACPNCGAPKKPIGSKSKITAALLAFFLGGIGGHKFYLGKFGQGILCLLFFWTGIPWLIAIIELCIYLGTTDAEFARKYG